TFYAERSWERLWSRAPTLGVPVAEVNALRALIARDRPNLKRDDAIAALRRVAESAAQPPRPQPSFQMERTAFWQDLVASARAFEAAIESNDDRITYEEVRDHIRVTLPDLEQRRRACLLLHLLDLEATRRGHRIEPVRIQEASEQFRRSRGLLTASATRAWLE